MNVLFLTLGKIDSIKSNTIYCDLLREFMKNGHSIYTLSPGKEKRKEEIYRGRRCTLAYVDIDTVRGGNKYIKKGWSTLMMGHNFKKGINKHYGSVKFDLILYSTPPITFVNAVEYVKNRDGAKTYLLLKDIFPQNAVDIGMMTTKGLRGIIYKYFRNQEKKLYAISDSIGCMSPANVKYVVENNTEIDPDIVDVCPNSIEVIDKSIDVISRNRIRKKYGVPINKQVLVYGGNLGKPQGIPFIIECLYECSKVDVFFLIVGDGTDYGVLEEYIRTSGQTNARLLKRLPKDDYDSLVAACDVGLIFLDHSFTIPNFPSRILSYMQAKIPVLACTDPYTDIGDIIVNGEFGWWCESNSAKEFLNTVKLSMKADKKQMGLNAFNYLEEYYSAEDSYRIIMKIEGN